jgi:ubiquinone/menaquinone biosynthesis C-methylase UbiE
MRRTGPLNKIPSHLVVTGVLLLALLGSAQAQAQTQPQPQTQTKPRRQATLFSPEDLGMLETPDRDVWQKPEQIMDSLGIADGSKVADIGAGGGYFTVRLAHRVGPNGLVLAEDVQEQMLEAIRRRVTREQLRNVRTVQGSSTDPMLVPPGQLDAILISETYTEIQYVNPLVFLQNVRNALRDGGRVGIVDYKKDGGGPGPDGPRPDPETIIDVAQRAGLRLLKRETFLPFQFFLIFGK